MATGSFEVFLPMGTCLHKFSVRNHLTEAMVVAISHASNSPFWCQIIGHLKSWCAVSCACYRIYIHRILEWRRSEFDYWDSKNKLIYIGGIYLVSFNRPLSSSPTSFSLIYTRISRGRRFWGGAEAGSWKWIQRQTLPFDTLCLPSCLHLILRLTFPLMWELFYLMIMGLFELS